MKQFIQKAATVLFSAGVLLGLGAAVGMAIAATTKVDAEVIYQTKEVVKTIEASAPVLERIAKCESGGVQFGKDGQLVINVNTNGTVDIGKYQINSIHNKTATKLGFNLSTLEGNEGFAKWMYANLGTDDWYSSAKCWKKS